MNTNRLAIGMSSGKHNNNNSTSTLNVFSEKGYLEFKVVDSGIGISEEGIKKLF